MRVQKGATLLLMGLVAAATGGVSATTPGAGRAGEAARRLQADSSGRAQVLLSPVTGTADLVVLEPGAVALTGSTPAARSLDFVDRYKELFGITDPYSELEPAGAVSDRLGRAHLRFRQVVEGLPVFGGELHAHMDLEGRLASVSGRLLADVHVDPEPSLPALTAEGLAAAVVAKTSGRPTAMLDVSPGRLLVYRTGLLAGRPGADHLAWEIEVMDGAAVAEAVYVDAHDGVILERIPRAHDLARRVSKTRPDNIIWREGDPLPYSGDSADADQEINQLIATAGASYQLFANLSGGAFQSWDGRGAVMHTLYDPDLQFLGDTQCPNAFWSGADRRMTVCAGMATDDVVAHEWTHAYTDATDALVYMWQSGALNESFSDIFGETLDQLDGLGLDSPDAHRGDGACSSYGAGPAPRLTVDAPAALAGDYAAGGAQFNPAGPFSVSARVELVSDGIEPASDACEPLVGFTPGRIAFVDRGSCNFIDKARRAEDAGAVGVIVANDQGDTLLTMAAPDGSSAALTIPSVFITQSDGEAIKGALAGTVRATISLDAATDPSVRWLVAEGAASGTLRDMWDPSCFRNPGRVGDATYYCNADDNGGVHVNSGVPNHAYALLADGGSYNGYTVRGIGLVKAINIYWRAMSVYQVPATDFAMHADFVQQSCRDLVGSPLPDPQTGAVSGQVISSDDCAQVTAAMLAVEMQNEPSQCGFPPILATSPPAFIGNRIAFFEDFDHGPPAGWQLTNQGVYPEYAPRDWAWTDHLPTGGEGGAYFALDSPTLGDCVAGSDDQSGVMRLTSPGIVVPPGAAPTLAFDHWVATESAYDGGLVEISVNGSPFRVVPRGAFTYNHYNLALESAGNGNTNPLAGKDAFTGTDAGSSRGSWGQSQVALSGLASAGDTIRVRFDFGVDGCNGVVGWYVDNVQVRTTDTAPRGGYARVRP